MTSLLLLIASTLLITQSEAAAPQSSPVHEFRSHPNWPAARPSDVGAIRGIVEAFFDAISTSKGETLDRRRLESLFAPGGRIEIPIQASDKPSTDAVFVSSDAYSDMSDTGTKHEGFFDHLIAMRVQQFSIMAHVWASYESRKNQNDPRPFVRGIKSFELLNRGGRWYITQVAWVREDKNNPIPAIYMHDSP
ncbi:hypothetical protein ACFPT7_12605 [Acidicapsa dinghuensis]|uniref:Nuclear transport factor 2 family protein n=1 Tax=Acidicapsa dinghuensis TaxID=2218256 RepID=A0ABW1EID6_9BACT|nr:hypothetical protein [Acidicapsa dinghuensis]